MTSTGARPVRGLRERLGAAIDYLEARLGEKLDLDGAARCSGFSRSHFMRLFQAAAGISVGEYVRLRRLSVAAESLAAGRRVLDAAVACGFDSQATFTRAFAKAFGVTPAAYARSVRGGHPPMPAILQYEPRLLARGIEVQGPARVEKPALRIAGVAARTTTRGGKALESVPALWEQWFASQRWRPLGKDPWTPLFGLSCLRASGDMEYVVGVEVEPKEPVPDGYRAVHLPGATYAVFVAQGLPARTIQQLVLAAYGRPRVDPELERRAGGWDVEIVRPDPGLPTGAMRCELWVPLRR